MRNVALFRAAFALALLSLTVNAMAQSATGQITGTVKDATGAVVPGATVTVTSELTGSKREVTIGQGRQLRDPAPAGQHLLGDRLPPGLQGPPSAPGCG